ncbi:MAG: hypothetical protein LBU15_03120 [Rickettsiales bacterium]|jgi:myo-inositol-1(or 4)-monophosphatase|nr:hypothetical protein [Rickettsiales bacterium]
MTIEDDFLDKILHFIKMAGKIAIDCQEHLTATLKADGSIVTQADLNISKLFRRRMADYLKTGEHCILDEEDLEPVANFFNGKKKYTWIIDPIDGSAPYYQGFPLWAVAVALFRDAKPYMGAIYMPSSRDLVYSDGSASYYAKRAFSSREEVITLEPRESAPLGKGIVLSRRCCDTSRRDYTVLDLYSNYVMSIYTLTNRSICQFFRSSTKLWDMAASMAIARTMGLCFRNVENGRDFDEISPELLDEQWALNGTYLMCNPRLYGTLRDSGLHRG